MAKRFFVNEKDITINEENISVRGNEVHHINVLRHKAGDLIKINRYLVKIKSIEKDILIGKIMSIEETDKISNVTLRLYQSYLKSDKMEYVVQKSVELGVDSITPFLSKNCVVKLESKDKVKKKERLNKISLEASKQCNRQDIAVVEDVTNIKDIIESLNSNDYNILAYENSQIKLMSVLEDIKGKINSNPISIGIIIGPEGGFDKTDIELLKNANNLFEISLGKRILRAETASLNLLSILNYVFDN